MDGVWFGQDRDVRRLVGDAEDGVEFRRIHVRIEGEIQGKTFFRLEPDLSRSPIILKDVYLGVRDFPPSGHLRIGHFREPFGLERLTPAADLLFLERSFTSAFAPGRNVGLALGGTAGTGGMTWAAGLFRETDDQGRAQTDRGGYAATGRLTGLVVDAAEDRYFHLGWATSLRVPPDDFEVTLVALEATLSPDYLGSAGVADLVLLGGAEVGLVLGRLTLAGEFTHGEDITDFDFGGGHSAFYVSGGYFLTDDHRPYDRERGTWGQVRPRSEGGAWEASLRLSAYTNWEANFLRDRGTLTAGTAGLSWFVNDHVRMGCNYGLAHLRDIGNTQTVGLRFQVCF